MRGPPRGGMAQGQYMPRGMGPRGHPYYQPMQHPGYPMIPPHHAMTPPYMPPPGPHAFGGMQPMMPMGGMPIIPPPVSSSHQPPPQREKKVLTIQDPRTGKVLDPSEMKKKTGGAGEATVQPVKEESTPVKSASQQAPPSQPRTSEHAKSTSKAVQDAPVTKTAPGSSSAAAEMLAKAKALLEASARKSGDQETPSAADGRKEPAAQDNSGDQETPSAADGKKEPAAQDNAKKTSVPGSPSKSTVVATSDATVRKSPKKKAPPTASASPKPETASPKTTPKKIAEPAAVASPKVTAGKKAPEKAAAISPKATAKKPETPISSPSVGKGSPKKKSKASTPIAEVKSEEQPKKVEVKPESKTTETVKIINSVVETVDGKLTYSISALLRFRDMYTELPDDTQGPDSKWPSMDVVADAGGRPRNSRNGTGPGNWEKQGSLNRQSSRGSSGGGPQWQRSQEPPKRGRSERGGRGGRGGRGAPEPLLEGPVKPLERSANRWIPVKATSNLEAAKKAVQSIMNKMTREKFQKLAKQLTEINMESLEMLQAVIKIIFDKALGEPHFCDMYADLCAHLEQKWGKWSFLKVVQNDDEKNFLWTTMSESDSEVVGPFDSVSEALDSADSDDFEPYPAPETMELSEVRIRNGKFVKIWTVDEDGSRSFFWSGQHLDDLGTEQVLHGPYASEDLANRYATKECSFKRILLNACQEEFEKDNIYEELEAEHKKAKEEGTLSAESAAEFEEKRIIMKGRMLGNIRFIGELYRKGMLQERIMHGCIMKLMGVRVVEEKLAPTHPGDAPDEESIESLCKLLTTMGKDLERHGQKGDAIGTYFAYLEKKLVKDKRLSSRIIFMIRDVIDLRNNRWEPRRKELQSKSLTEIRKEAEREQQRPPPSSGSSGRSDSYRMDSRRSASSRDGGFSQRSTISPIHHSQSMSSRSGGMNKVTLPVDWKSLPRDDSVKQGRPASFGAASRRSGAPAPVSTSRKAGSGTQPQSTSKGAPKDASGRASPAKTKAPLSDDDKEAIAKKSKSIAEEYVSIVDIDEADACFGELLKEFNNHPDVPALFAQEVLQTAVEAKKSSQEGMFNLVEKLSIEKNSLSFDGVRRGLEKMIEVGVDLLCDVPKMPEHIGDIVARFVRVSERSKITLDWLMSACNQSLAAEVIEELIDSGLLMDACGDMLRRLKQGHPDKASSQIRGTCICLLSVFPSHRRTPKDLHSWVQKYGLVDVVGLEPAFGFIEQWTESKDFDGAVRWIDAHIPEGQRKDPFFVAYVCLFVLLSLKKGELPSNDEGMLLTGFCHDLEGHTRLVAFLIQVESDEGNIKRLLKHLVRDAIPAAAFAKWLELKNDNSVGRKQALDELGDFVEGLSRVK
ncbi:hypothetical protein PINS_up015381 [Pythium insidiosum]|nr:hypothetical protein PINS_up015381 [Pythium insidiosum]